MIVLHKSSLFQVFQVSSTDYDKVEPAARFHLHSKDNKGEKNH